MPTPLHSNAAIFRAISEEALAKAQTLLSESRTPKPDGSPGYVISIAKRADAYKQSLIAIAFASFHFEAMLYIQGRKATGARWDKQHDAKSYEDKLKVLGIHDGTLLASAERLRKSRRDLVHEKAVPVGSLKPSDTRSPHEEAKHAIKFLAKISSAFASAA